MIYHNIEQLIGDTPLLKIDERSHGLKHIDVYAKLEYQNPFGSIKDRTVLGLTKNIDFERLRTHGTKLIESSSGNTAKALQLVASKNGTNLVSVTNRVKIPEVDQLLRYIGTEIVALPGRSECPDPSQDDNALSRIESMVRTSPGAYVHTAQYTNRANPHIHSRTTAHEIFEDMPGLDYIVTSVGTGGSSGGIIDYIKSRKLATKTIGVTSHPSDFIPGIRTKNELFETALFKQEWFESIEEVSSQKALEALDVLIRNEGMLAGPTTGASFAVLTDYLRKHDTPRADGSRRSVVFIACDRLESYMSYVMKRRPERFDLHIHTNLFSKVVEGDEISRIEVPATESTREWLKEHHVQIIDIRGVKPYAAFHVEGSLSYPEEVLREALEQATPFEDKKPILFVCPKGDHSLLLAAVLRARGLEAYSLKGGLLAWRSADLPLIRRDGNG